MDPMGDVKGPTQIIQNSGRVLGVGMIFSAPMKSGNFKHQRSG